MTMRELILKWDKAAGCTLEQLQVVLSQLGVVGTEDMPDSVIKEELLSLSRTAFRRCQDMVRELKQEADSELGTVEADGRVVPQG